MPRVPILRPEHAPKESYQIYVEFYRRMAFPSPPNFIMTQGHSAATARGTWGLVSNVLVAGEIPRWKKEIVFVAISKDRKCKYCDAAHFACCRMLGVKPEILNEMAENIASLSDPQLKTMVHFALKCSRDPQALTEEDFQGLNRAGLKQSEVVELIAMSALAVYANIMADATQMEPDEMFAEFSQG